MAVAETEVTETKVSLSDAIGDAIKSTDKALGTVTDGSVEDKVVETKVEDKKEDKSKEEEELTLQGRQLMMALKDPEKAGIVIKFLAEQAGYSKVETKVEAREVKDELLETLKESLGSEFDFLSEKLAPAISKIVDAQLAKNTKDIREDIENRRLQETQNQADTALKTLSKDFFGKDEIPDDVATTISSLMDKYPPNAKMTVQDYVKDMFGMAVASKGLTKVTSTSDRVDRNRNDAASRLAASEGVREPSGTVVNSNKPMTLDAAVKAAIEEADKKVK